MGQKLFGRAWSLTVGLPSGGFGLDVSDQKIEFNVKRNLKPEPNTATIKVWNLNESSRQNLEGEKKLTVRLEAGYQGAALAQIYFGEVRAAWSVTEGPNIITTLETGDSAKEYQNAKIRLTLGPKTPPDIALRNIVEALGIGAGNIDHAVTLLKTRGLASLGNKRTVISGYASVQLTDFCKAAGLEWSIQDGALQILDRGRPLTETLAVKLSSDTGLVGSPTVDSKGVASATALIIPEIRPGVKVAFESKHLEGGFRVEECEWTGDSYGQDWTVKFSAKKY